MATKLCIVEAEFFTKAASSPRETGSEIFRRLLQAPEPIACVRYFVPESILSFRFDECQEAERERDRIRHALQREESVGMLGTPHGSLSAKALGQSLARLGDALSRARERVMALVEYSLLYAAAEHQEILIRAFGRFKPLDRTGVLSLSQALEGHRPGTATLYRSGTLLEPERTEMLVLA